MTTRQGRALERKDSRTTPSAGGFEVSCSPCFPRLVSSRRRCLPRQLLSKQDLLGSVLRFMIRGIPRSNSLAVAAFGLPIPAHDQYPDSWPRLPVGLDIHQCCVGQSRVRRKDSGDRPGSVEFQMRRVRWAIHEEGACASLHIRFRSAIQANKNDKFTVPHE